MQALALRACADRPQNLAPEAQRGYEGRASQGTFMLFLRVLGKTLLFAAFMAVAYDGTRILATPSEGVLLSSISQYLQTYVPNGQEDLQQFFLARGPAYLWNGIVEPLLGFPVSIVLGVFGALLFLSGYRRPPPEITGD